MQQTLEQSTPPTSTDGNRGNSSRPRTNTQSPPERKGVYWGGKERDIEQMHVIGQLGSMENENISHNSIAWVTEGREEYLTSRDTKQITIPNTYSVWDNEFGDGDGLYRSSTMTKNGETVQLGIPAQRAKAAMRILTGGGHYDADKYVMYDCVPVPVLQGPEGAVAIAPVEIRVKK